MNAGNDNVQCSPLSRGRRPKEINCCLVLSCVYNYVYVDTHINENGFIASIAVDELLEAGNLLVIKEV